MSKRDVLIQRLQAILPTIGKFISTEYRNDFSIMDVALDGSFIIENIDAIRNTCSIQIDKNLVEISYDDSKLFNVINSDTAFFIPIDGKKGFLGYGISYCDFTLFNKECFCFVELKLNAISESPNAVFKNRNKAIAQLKSTISYFDEKLGKDYSGLGLEAIVATPTFYPRKNTAWEALEIQFLEEEGIPLSESTQKDFLIK